MNAASAQVVDSPLDSEEAKEEGLPFRGSSFSFTQSVAGNSFFRDTQLSFNPYYNMAFDLTLVWHFNRVFQVILDQAMQVELTDSDTTRLVREPLFSDTTGTFDALVAKQKVSAQFQWQVHTSATLSAPTSLASQAATLVLGTRLGATGTISLPKVLDGLGINLNVNYVHRFLRSNVVEVATPYPCAAGSTSLEFCGALGSRTNARLGFTATLSSELALNDKWGISASYMHSWRRGADLADYTFISDDGARVALPDGSRQHWRNVSTIDIGVSYFVINWLGLGLNATNIFQERGPDSELRPPLKLADTFIGLNATLRLDELYLTASGGPKNDEED